VKQALITYAAVLQIVVILLLQFYQIAPNLSHKPSRPQCRGNHAECGCAPERVAAHTCCCCQRKPSCCDKDGHHEEDHLAAQKGKPALPYLSMAPCGGSPKFITASLDKLKFIRTDVQPSAPAGYTGSFPLPGPESAQSRFREPLVPPPKSSLFS